MRNRKPSLATSVGPVSRLVLMAVGHGEEMELEVQSVALNAT